MNRLHIVADDTEYIEVLKRGELALLFADFRARLARHLESRRILSDEHARLLALRVAREERGRPFFSRVAHDDELFERAAGTLVNWMQTLRAYSVPGPTWTEAAKRSSRVESVVHLLSRVVLLEQEHGVLSPAGVPMTIASRLREATDDEVIKSVGAKEVIASPYVRWTDADLLWWRVLNERLVRLGGVADVSTFLPEGHLDPARDDSAIETWVDVLARAMDSPARSVALDPKASMIVRGRWPADVAARVIRCPTLVAEADQVAGAVALALSRGESLDRVAVALCDARPHIVRAVERSLADRNVLSSMRGERATSELLDLVCYVVRGPDHGADHRGSVRDFLARLFSSAWIAPRDVSRSECVRIGRAFSNMRWVTAASIIESVNFVFAEARLRFTSPASREAAFDIVRSWIALEGTRTRASHVILLREFLGRLGVVGAVALPPHGEKTVAPLAQWCVERAISVEQRALVQFDRALSELECWALLDPTEAVSRRVFAHEVASLLERDVDAMRGIGVRVAPLHSFAQGRFGHVVVSRMHDACVKIESPLARAFGNDLARTLSPVTDACARASMSLRFATLISSADAVTFIVSGNADEELGDVATPVRAALGIGAPLQPGRRREVSLPTPLAEHRIARVRERAQRFFDQGTPDPVLLNPDVAAFVRHRTGDGMAVRASTLDAASVCAFRGFATLVLRVTEIEPSSQEPDARERGTLRHAALEAACIALADGGVGENRWATIERAIEKAIGLGRERSPIRRADLEQIAREALHVARQYAADPTWTFRAAEALFDDALGAWLPAIRIEHNGQCVAIQGRADRVDIAEGGRKVRIVDYKSSESVAKAKMKVLGERAFQLNVFARGVYDAGSAQTVEVSYVPVRANKVSESKMISRDDPGIARMAERLVQLRGGVWHPTPDSNECEYCAFDVACRRPQFLFESGKPEPGEPESIE